MRKRITLIAAAVAALAVSIVAATSAAVHPTAATATSAVCSASSLHLVKDGQLTIGTDNPAYPPWYAGGSPKGSSWKINDPSTGKGFESAVAYAIAKQLGFSKGQVKWSYVPFNKAFAPGAKSFDFDINQISYTPARAKVVSFSASYYDVNQAIVVKKGTKIAGATSIADLKPYKLGVQIGTTSYQYIKDNIKPSQQPAVYDTNDAAVAALKNGQTDALVVDLPTAFYVTAVQVPNSKILGQFESTTGEHFGMVFAKGNPLVKCVNQALAGLKADGTLKRIQDRWLSQVVAAPVLK
jgi:polar amino acid transport system substrate-binding protein